MPSEHAAAAPNHATPIADEVGEVLHLLDDAMSLRRRIGPSDACSCFPMVMLCAGPSYVSAEYAFRLWAGANELSIEERLHRCGCPTRRYRIVRVKLADGGYLAALHCPAEVGDAIENVIEVRS